MNTYICFWKGKKFEVKADTQLKARDLCAAQQRIKKAYEITTVLAEKDGETVTHVAVD